MEKYRYNYSLVQNTKSTYEYTTGLLDARIDFINKNVYRVAMYKKGTNLLPTFSVSPEDYKMTAHGRERLSLENFEMFEPVVNEVLCDMDTMGNNKKTEYILGMNGEYKVSLSLPGFFLTVYKNGNEKPLLADRAYSPYNYDGELGEGVAHFLKAERYEEIFGLGEKSGDVNKFGRRFELSARDAMGYDASSTDPLYKHIPFYICRNSVGTFGVYYDTHAKGSFNFMEEMDNYYGHFKSFRAEDDALVYYIFLGNIKTIRKNFARLMGRTVFSPKWTLDYQGSTMAYTDASDADSQLRGFLNNCKKLDLRVSGFYLSSGYTSIGNKRYVFNWNTEKIPDPKDLIKHFKESGVHFIPNIKPAFLEDHPMYEMIAKNGWFLHYKDGSPAKIPFWDGYGSFLDFTNPGAFNFWTGMVKEKLIDYGMDAIWNDNNEYYLEDRSILAYGFGNEIPAYRICQVLTTLMVMSSDAAFEDKSIRHMMSTRSGCGGLNRLAQTWTGDNFSSFKDLHYNHKMAMGMSLSAVPLLGHDLGGFAGDKPSEELLMRWLQYGVFLPRFCVHSWNEDGSVTEPWMYEGTVDTVKKLFEFRYKIKPYLYNLLYKVHADYDTFITPVFHDYEDYNVESDAFLVGHDVLVNPIFYEGINEVSLLLPNTGWYKAEEYFEGNTKLKIKCTIYDIPVMFHREGSVFVEYISDKSEEKCYTVYALEHGEFSESFYDDDGISSKLNEEHMVNISVICEKDKVIVKTNNREINIKLVDRFNRELVCE